MGTERRYSEDMRVCDMVEKIYTVKYPEKYRGLQLEFMKQIKDNRILAGYCSYAGGHHFAHQAIAMYDNSFLHKGKSGFMITRCGLFTDTFKQMEKIPENREYVSK